MQDETTRDLLIEAARHRVFVNRIMESLTRAEHFILLRDQYKIHIAADFSEVFAYCFPAFDKLSVRMPTAAAPGDDEFTRQQLGVAYLFRSLGKGGILLLPPYEVELQDRLTVLRGRMAVLRGAFAVSRDSIKGLVAEMRHKLDIDAVASKMAEGIALTADENRSLVGALKMYLPEMYRELLLLYSDPETGAQAIDALLKSSTLLDLHTFAVDRKWQIEQFSHERVIETYQETLTHLMKRRPVTDYYSNCLDAMAIQYVSILNAEVIPKGEVLLLASRGATARLAKRSKASVKAGNRSKEIELSWTPDELYTCLLYDACRTDEGRKRIESLKQLTRQYMRLSDDLKSMGSPNANPTRARILCQEMKPILEQAVACYNDQQALRMVGSFASDLSPELDRISSIRKPTEDAAFAKTVLQLIQGDKQIFDEINSQLDRVVGTTSEYYLQLGTYLGLREEIIDLKQTAALRVDKIASVSLPHKYEIAGWVGEGMPYKIKFQSEGVAKVVERFTRAHMTPEDLADAFQGLAHLIKQKPDDDEVHLLVAYVQALSGQHKIALREVGRAVDLSSHSNPEAHFLQAVLRRMDGDLKGALFSCELATKGNPDNARYLKELGYIIWQCLAAKKACEYSLDDAIQLTQKAMRVYEDPELLPSIVNNLAYYLSERNNPGDLEEALKLFSDLSVPRNQWNGHMLHTDVTLRLKKVKQDGVEIGHDGLEEILEALLRDAKIARDNMPGERFMQIVDSDVEELRALLKEQRAWKAGQGG